MSDNKGASLATPISIFLAGVLIAAAILATNLGFLDQFKSKKAVPTVNNPSAAGDTQAEPGIGEEIAKVSIDDDPVMGDPNAPVTMIEFSDYECPFCKRYFTTTYPQLKSEYVDTGMLKIVFRDLPLAFHDPAATIEANAANCAREQGGDGAYFSYHDAIFNQTEGNGTGISNDGLIAIAQDLSLNTSEFSTCLSENRYNDEIQKDLVDASNVGASGTPSFYVGKSTSDGIIEGQKISGAQPYVVFKSIIDAQLN